MKTNIKNNSIHFFQENGYLIFNISDDKLINEVNKDVEEYVQKGDFKTNSKIYSYNYSPRIVESWKVLDSCKRLSLSQIVINTLESLYDASPKAFSTINFLYFLFLI